MKEYLEAVRKSVCSVCIDGIFDGSEQFIRCGLPEEKICPIEVYLPEVIKVVESIESPQMGDYINLLREQVCKNCLQNSNGKCELRLHADCPLDRYFILVAVCRAWLIPCVITR